MRGVPPYEQDWGQESSRAPGRGAAAQVVLVKGPEAVLDLDKGDIVGNEAPHRELHFNRRLIAGGGVLISIGGLLGFTGMLLVSSAIVSAARQRINQLEQPPREIAKLKWQQARAATTAGAQAWRNSPSAKVSS
jgi:hypothetical protein